MICEECGLDEMLTYHSIPLKRKSVCAQCIKENHPDFRDKDVAGQTMPNCAHCQKMIEGGGNIALVSVLKSPFDSFHTQFYLHDDTCLIPFVIARKETFNI